MARKPKIVNVPLVNTLADLEKALPGQLALSAKDWEEAHQRVLVAGAQPSAMLFSGGQYAPVYTREQTSPRLYITIKGGGPQVDAAAFKSISRGVDPASVDEEDGAGGYVAASSVLSADEMATLFPDDAIPAIQEDPAATTVAEEGREGQSACDETADGDAA
jgi:hypothetical protein